MSNVEKCKICSRTRFPSGTKRPPHDHECVSRVAPTCQPSLDRMHELLRKARISIYDLLSERDLDDPTAAVSNYAQTLLEEFDEFEERLG